jgi:hypothetical protein
VSYPIALFRWPLVRNFGYEPVSDSSLKIQQLSAQERNPLRGSASDWFPTINAAFLCIKNDCSIADWDSGGAIPISSQTIGLTAEIVERLFTMLPKGTPAPDLIPEADGEICLSWSVDANRLFSLSIGEDGKINFAGQFGNEGGIHGWQPIYTTSLTSLEKSLQDVARHIGRVFAPPNSKRKAR